MTLMGCKGTKRLALSGRVAGRSRPVTDRSSSMVVAFADGTSVLC